VDGDGLVLIADSKQIPGFGVGCDRVDGCKIHGNAVTALYPDDIVIISYFDHSCKLSRADIVRFAVEDINMDGSTPVINPAHHLCEKFAEFASVDVNVGSHLCTSVII